MSSRGFCRTDKPDISWGCRGKHFASLPHSDLSDGDNEDGEEDDDDDDDDDDAEEGDDDDDVDQE